MKQKILFTHLPKHCGDCRNNWLSDEVGISVCPSCGSKNNRNENYNSKGKSEAVFKVVKK